MATEGEVREFLEEWVERLPLQTWVVELLLRESCPWLFEDVGESGTSRDEDG